MTVTVPAEMVDLIRNSQDALLLGIINKAGVVSLAAADAIGRPGHRAWLQQDRTLDPIGGFSVYARNGFVECFFCMSELKSVPSSANVRLPPTSGYSRLERSNP